MDHVWRNLVPSNDPRYYVRGTELEVSLPAGFSDRFAVYGVRTIERDPSFKYEYAPIYDRRYIVRDAHTVTDAEMMERKRPAIVAQFATQDELDAWLERQR